MTKRERITILLQTHDDPYPCPQGTLTDRDTGINPSKIPCRTCKGKGQVERKVMLHGRQNPVRRLVTCPDCHGEKYRRARKDEKGVDPYTYEPVPGAMVRNPKTGKLEQAQFGYDADPARHRIFGKDHNARDEARARDASLARLTRDALAREGKFDKRESYSWEKACQRRDAAGDYPKLRRLLDHKPPDADPLTWLEHHWHGPVKIPWWHEPHEDRATLDQLVREGKTATQIARALHIDRRAAQRALARSEAA